MIVVKPSNKAEWDQLLTAPQYEVPGEGGTLMASRFTRQHARGRSGCSA